jgi:hypothetical protein
MIRSTKRIEEVGSPSCRIKSGMRENFRNVKLQNKININFRQ